MIDVRRRYVLAGAVVVVFLVIVAGGAGLGAAMYVTAQQDAEAEADRADDAQSRVEEVCADKAAEGGEECTPEQLTGPAGPKGDKGDPGLPATDAQVYAAVSLVMSQRDLLTMVDPEAFAAAVAEAYAANPPKDGKDGKDATPVTAQQLLDAVTVYLTANPPPPGEKGDPGRPPTAEEILAVLTAYLDENPGPFCPASHPLTEVDLLALDGRVYTTLICARPAN